MLPVGLGLDDAWTDPASSETLAELWRPYLSVCINAFGVDRCMFASNFPVDKVRWGVARLGSVGRSWVWEVVRWEVVRWRPAGANIQHPPWIHH